MMKHIKLFLPLAIIICLLITHNAQAQSPWVTKKSGYSHISFGIIPTYDRVFDGGQSNLDDLNGDIIEWSIQSYTEYGITDKIGIVAEIPFRYVSATVGDSEITDRQEGNISGLGNVGVGLKYNLINNKFLVTAQANINLQTNASDDGSGLRTDYEANSLTPMISIGKGTAKWYFYAYTGVSLYSNNLSNNFVYGIEYGYRPMNQLIAIVSLTGKESFFDGNRVYGDNYEETHLYVNNQLYHSLALRLTYEITENMGLNGSTNLISVRARRLPFQSPFSLALYYKWGS